MSTSTEIMNEIINNINIVEVPVEFIVMAQITDIRGVERFVKGDEFRKIIPNPHLHEIREAKVILNVHKIKKAIVNEVNAIYEDVNRRFNEKYFPETPETDE